MFKQLRRLLELLTQFLVGTGRTMPHGDQVVLPHEHAGFAVGDLLAFQVGSLDDDEQLVAIDVDLGNLHAVQCVLDRQGMKPEHRLETGHFVRGGITNPDPDELTFLDVERLGGKRHLYGAFAGTI